MRIRLLTFNIRNGEADDGPNSWPSRRHACAEAIRRVGANIIGLQEVFEYQLSYLLAELPEYQSAGVGRDDGQAKGEFAPVLWRSDELRLLGDGTFWFSDTREVPGSVSWGNKIPRICTWVDLEGDSTRLTVCNVHLDHESAESRRKSALMLPDRATGGNIQLILGDFNADEHWAPISILKARGFRDTFREVHPESRFAGTFHGFQERCFPEKIDYIFVRGQVDIADAGIVHERVHGLWPSDHALVTAELVLK